MRYVSLFSGIEAASVAWGQLDWTPVAFSEIDPFPCAVLAERFPDVPNLGDISNIDWGDYVGSVDLVVGGSPCQAFSIAGRRQGLLDQRGLLMLEYVRAVRELHPKWLLWENVPGVFSQSDGDAFETFQRELEQCGYSLAWRTFDAQFFGVTQRRKRCFLVGHSDIGCAAAVLFEREALRWDCQTGKEKRQQLSVTANRNAGNEGCFCLQGSLICIADDTAHAAIDINLCGTLKCGGAVPYFTDGVVIRNLTPVECERLQGFPDNWTQISWHGKPADQCPDAPRYKALGNSMAVPVMLWIGKRIQMVEQVMSEKGMMANGFIVGRHARHDYGYMLERHAARTQGGARRNRELQHEEGRMVLRQVCEAA